MAKYSTKNIFKGADDVYLTKKSIAVRRVSSSRKADGTFLLQDKTRYYKKNARNMKLLKSTYGRVRFGRV